MDRKNLILLFVLVLFSCNNNFESKISGDSLKEDKKLNIQKFINDDDLLQHVLYVTEVVDSFPDWNYPLVYIIRFDSSHIGIYPFHNNGVTWNYTGDIWETDFGIGCFEYDGYVFQIFDDSNVNDKYNYYNPEFLIPVHDVKVKLYSEAYGDFESFYDEPARGDNWNYGYLYYRLFNVDTGLILYENNLLEEDYDFYRK